MRKLSSAKTRRIVNYLLHPRPTPIYPRLTTHTRYRRAYRKTLLESYDCLQESRRTDAHLAFAITQSFVSQVDGQAARTEAMGVAQGPGVLKYELKISSGDKSPVRSGRQLRSYRTMKYRSIRDYAVDQETRRACTAFADVPAGRNLRQMPRISACHTSILEGTYSHDELAPPDQPSIDSSHESSGSARYFTAKSAFNESNESGEEYQRTILQVLDTESGVIFNRVCQGSKGTLKAEHISPDVLDEQHAVTVRVDSPGRLRRNLGTDNLIGMLAQPVPSVMLTLPTPQPPASPVFVPQSPITVAKFITAAESSPNPVTTDRKLVPSMQFCPDCTFVPPDSGFLCYSCDRQWLACKVWYQANDGGRRGRLTEPYIRPAESNATNRALVDFLRAPSGSGNSYGLGIRATPEVVLSKSRFKKLAPFLAMATAESSVSLIYHEEVLPFARRTMAAVDLRVLAVLPRKLWATIVAVLSYNSRLLLRLLDSLVRHDLRAGHDLPSVSDYLWMITEDSVDEAQFVARLARTTSRFLEHLED
ncbi:hypothetical protein DAEQUDRAFT_808373 [Daedalea quercina L-15889]|uniref:Uncharacterized protein n=1 Tax=Daedalea quercina L-15889 TaxID=1314783 RepID=A0A165TCS3_9APHY|nr:hypothetical protein DAEQUDRAFT_808373 [Daedalea quercina L-15889]